MSIPRSSARRAGDRIYRPEVQHTYFDWDLPPVSSFVVCDHASVTLWESLISSFSGLLGARLQIVHNDEPYNYRELGKLFTEGVGFAVRFYYPHFPGWVTGCDNSIPWPIQYLSSGWKHWDTGWRTQLSDSIKFPLYLAVGLSPSL